MVRRGNSGGRPSKGKRDQLICRVPWDLGEAVREQAEEAGVSLSDYMAYVLAREVGRADLVVLHRRRAPEEELPIPAA